MGKTTGAEKFEVFLGPSYPNVLPDVADATKTFPAVIYVAKRISDGKFQVVFSSATFDNAYSIAHRYAEQPEETFFNTAEAANAFLNGPYKTNATRSQPATIYKKYTSFNVAVNTVFNTPVPATIERSNYYTQKGSKVY